MSVFRQLLRRSGDLKKAVAKNADKIDQGITKAARTADQRTGGKHGSKIDQASKKLSEQVRKIERQERGPGGSEGTHR